MRPTFGRQILEPANYIQYVREPAMIANYSRRSCDHARGSNTVRRFSIHLVSWFQPRGL